MRTVNHTVKDPNGIHARPAGVIVNTAKKFASDIKLISGEKTGDCKRIFSIMGMSLKAGDNFAIEIIGADEDEAAKAMEFAITESGI